MAVIRKRTASALLAATALGTAVPASAQNFIVNGGFEDGVQADGKTPVGWTPNEAYVTGGYDGVVAHDAHSGTNALQIGNYDVDPLEALSQTFTDLVGGTYTVNFFGLTYGTGDPNAFLTTAVGGQSVTFTDDNTPPGTYKAGTFTFVGTGSDTLTISARTNPNDWYVDDVSVTGPAVGSPPSTGAVPEPASWAMMIGGMGMIGAALRYRRRRPVLRSLTV